MVYTINIEQVLQNMHNKEVMAVSKKKMAKNLP